MSKKGENIFKRKDGRWEARYVKDRAPSGKIMYGFCYGKTYREAKEKACQKKADLMKKETPPASGGRKFSAYCQEWLAGQEKQVKESTYVKYDTIVKKHILPQLGGCEPDLLNSQAIESFKRGLLDGLSPKTVKDILVVFHAILNFTAQSFPGRLPVPQIIYPKEEKKEIRILTLEEQRLFMSYLQKDMDFCKFGILLAMMTGLRIGEICALRWGNISIDNRMIYVNATLQRLKNIDLQSDEKTRVIIGSPKSGTSVRMIPLSERGVALCRKMSVPNPDFFVLTGGPCHMEPRTLQYRLRKYTKDCGLEGVHFHTLRHTFATRCIEADFELKSLSEILGHANTSVTLNRYIHSSLQLKRNNMSKLDQFGL